MKAPISILILILLFSGCQSDDPVSVQNELILGADLSYVNEMLDCGAIYRSNGEVVNPYELFAREGCQMVRIRKWHTPSFNSYSNLEDVQQTALQSAQNGMQILLDLHYSDSWADPAKQIIPAAWSSISDLSVLGDSVYNYTQMVLSSLLSAGSVPKIVQIGNEINTEILMDEEVGAGQQINWERNASLLNRGLEAIADFNQSNNQSIETLLHIAQPENVTWWFEQAELNNVSDFDWIGISYYPQWSNVSLDNLDDELLDIKQRFGKRILIVETAYPYTLSNADQASNILGEDAGINTFGISSTGQLDYLNTLKQAVLDGGAEGIIYWEPAWVSTDCNTQWAQGSHWDNATFFDASNNNEALKAFDFFE